MKIIKKSIFVIVPLFLITLLSCQPRITKHGNFFNLENIQLIKKSKLSKSEVIEIFGEPTVKSTFSDNVWYYITLVQHEKAYFEIKNLENKILAITFDENQLVKFCIHLCQEKKFFLYTFLFFVHRLQNN